MVLKAGDMFTIENTYDKLTLHYLYMGKMMVKDRAFTPTVEQHRIQIRSTRNAAGAVVSGTKAPQICSVSFLREHGQEVAS